jgi:hypothetical protein
MVTITTRTPGQQKKIKSASPHLPDVDLNGIALRFNKIIL